MLKINIVKIYILKNISNFLYVFFFSNKICPYNFYIKYFIMNIIIIKWAILFENCSNIIEKWQTSKEKWKFYLKNWHFLYKFGQLYKKIGQI